MSSPLTCLGCSTLGRTAKCVRREKPLSHFDRRSIRTVVRGNTRILIGCPKGSWMPRKQRCKVGTQAHEVIKVGACSARSRAAGGRTVR